MVFILDFSAKIRKKNEEWFFTTMKIAN